MFLAIRSEERYIGTACLSPASEKFGPKPSPITSRACQTNMGDSIDTTVYTVEDLKESPDILHDLVSATNLAWTQNEKAGFEGPRFASNEDLLQLLGSDGLCAAARSDAIIIASASTVPWLPRSGGDVNRALRRNGPPSPRW